MDDFEKCVSELPPLRTPATGPSTLEQLAFAVVCREFDRYDANEEVSLPAASKRALLEQVRLRKMTCIGEGDWSKWLRWVLDEDILELHELYLQPQQLRQCLQRCSRLQLLHLPPSLREEDLGELTKLLPRTLRTLHLNNRSERDGPAMAQLLLRCSPTLENLQINGSSSMNLQSLVQHWPPQAALPMLRSLEVDGCGLTDEALALVARCASRLTRCRITSQRRLTCVGLQSVLMSCPELEVFVARGNREADTQLELSPECTPRLRELDLRNMDQLLELTVVGGGGHGAYLSALERLDLIGTSHLSLSSYQALYGSCRQLKHLAIGNLGVKYQTVVADILLNCHSTLESFYTSSINALCPAVPQILSTCPRLTALDFVGPLGDASLLSSPALPLFSSLQSLRLSSSQHCPCASSSLTSLVVSNGSIPPTQLEVMLANSAQTLKMLQLDISHDHVPMLPAVETARIRLTSSSRRCLLELPSARAIEVQGAPWGDLLTSPEIVIRGRDLSWLRLHGLRLDAAKPVRISTLQRDCNVHLLWCDSTAGNGKASPLVVEEHSCKLAGLTLKSCPLQAELLVSLCSNPALPRVEWLEGRSPVLNPATTAATALVSPAFPIDCAAASDLSLQADLEHIEVLASTSLARLSLAGCRSLSRLFLPAPGTKYLALQTLVLRGSEAIRPPALLKTLDKLPSLTALDLYDVQSFNKPAIFQQLLEHAAMRQLCKLDVGRLRMLRLEELRQMLRLPALYTLGCEGLVRQKYGEDIGENLLQLWRDAHAHLIGKVELEIYIDCHPRF